MVLVMMMMMMMVDIYLPLHPTPTQPCMGGTHVLGTPRVLQETCWDFSTIIRTVLDSCVPVLWVSLSTSMIIAQK